MTRYIADYNKLVGIFESGTSGEPMTGSSFWIGQVQEHSVDEAENKLVNRYLGTETRSYDAIEQGPRDVTGTFSYHPMDMRLPFWCVGSIFDTSGTNSEHTATEVNTNVRQNPFVSGTGDLNPPISFTLEDSKQAAGTGKNFIRTINGVCINNVTITSSQGEKVKVNINYIGKTSSFSSGTTTAVTEITGRPYLWSDCSLTLGTNAINTAKEIALAINQNFEAPHYINGSRDISTPYPKDRENSLSVTMDLDSDVAKTLYETYYKSNTTFNGVFDLDADSTTGSQHTIYTLSGCKVMSMENPSTIDGATESSIEIMPKTISAVEYTSLIGSGQLNPW